MLTLEEEKRLVLLTSIIELGGAPSKARALDWIFNQGYMAFDDADLAFMANRNEESWRNDLAFIRLHLVLERHLDDSKRNCWRITDSGRKHLFALLRQSKPTGLRKATIIAWERARAATT